MGRYDARNVVKRLEREARHNERALEEKSKSITNFEFIDSIEVFYYSGEKTTPKDEFTIHVLLKHPVLYEDFKDFINNKLKGSIAHE